jgi:hypothetical protein
VHRLPRQLGWGLGLLAFVCSLAIDFQRAPDQELASLFGHAMMWGGLCAILCAIVGYLVCLALGTNIPPPEEPTLVPLPPAEEEPLPQTGQLMDMAVGDEIIMPPIPDVEEEFSPYSPEEVAQAIRTQLGAEESRLG